MKICIALTLCLASACFSSNDFDPAADGDEPRLGPDGGPNIPDGDVPFDGFDLDREAPDDSFCSLSDAALTHPYRPGSIVVPVSFEARLDVVTPGQNGGSVLNFASGDFLESTSPLSAWTLWLGRVLRVSHDLEGVTLTTSDTEEFVAFVGGWLLDTTLLSDRRTIGPLIVETVADCQAITPHRSGRGSCPDVRLNTRSVNVRGEVIPRGSARLFDGLLVRHDVVGERGFGTGTECADGWTPIFGIEVVRQR